MTHTFTRTYSYEVSCTRRIQFCAGHRVWQHEGKCAHPHGHNYVALITAVAPKLDVIGRVIDFSVLKERIGGWIDACWDHGFIYFKDDEEMKQIFEGVNEDRWKCWALPVNPTAENMASYLLHTVCPRELAGTNVEVIEVQLWETENCYALAKKERE